MEIFQKAWGCLYSIPTSRFLRLSGFQYIVSDGYTVSLPEQSAVLRILEKIRTLGANAYKIGSDHQHINRLIAWYSKYTVQITVPKEDENRVALSDHIIRAYISHCWNCKNCN